MEATGTQDIERPAFARGGTETVELRGECPRQIVNVLDAVSMARDKTRTALVNEILGAWADKVLHESMLVHRIAGVNPALPDATGRGVQDLRVVGETSK
jgi:hypothetical protein